MLHNFASGARTETSDTDRVSIFGERRTADTLPGFAAIAVAFFFALASRWVALLRFLALASATFLMGLVAKDINLFFICSNSAGGSGTWKRKLRREVKKGQGKNRAEPFMTIRCNVKFSTPTVQRGIW